ncbi:MAG TPA: TetR/AcrR family transcriptional regulator [Mycobacteriales bacterium]|nr:TetR/AcrR family transcriptional regulator [Mycobacteriales bacterium]
MGSKAAATRERIVEKAARVFNRHGYAATSMAVLLDEVGLRKGGLYNHFASKEQLAVESFDYAVRCVTGRFETALAAVTGAPARLRAVVDVMSGLVRDPALPGGCPVMRTAVESVDGHPALRERAREAMTTWQRLVGRIVRDGIAAGEIVPGVEPRQVATLLTATLEGAVMLSLLLGDPKQMRHAEAHLDAYIVSISTDAA